MAPTSNEELQKQIAQLKKEKEKLDAEKEKLDAEKAKLDGEKAKLEAEKALVEAQKALKQAKDLAAQQLTDLQNQKALVEARKALEQATDPATQQLSELQNQKALVEAQKGLTESQKALEQAKSASGQQVTELQSQKALADAQKGLTEAQTQAAIARYIGDVKAGPYSGSVEMKEKGGTEEALLLAARAVKECAAKVATAVQSKANKFYIFSADKFPSFQQLLNFRFRKEMLKQAFTAANVSKAMAKDAVAAPALVSAGLEALSKILGFFKTDYTIGGIDAKIDESLLLFAVAGRLSGKEVHLPSIYEPNALDPTIGDLVRELAELLELRTIAASEAKQIKDELAEAEKEAAAAETEEAADPESGETEDAESEEGETEGDPPKNAATKNPRLDELNGVIALYDAFASSLITPDSKGDVPLSAVAREFAIDAALKAGGAVLLLRLENSGGGYLLKKNFLTGLGAMPLYHMGGATVTYLLLSGAEGRVLAGDAIPVYGGFVRTDSLRDVLAQ